MMQSISRLHGNLQMFFVLNGTPADITERLYHLNLPLYTQAHEILMHNKEQRHIRGGMATRRKYRGE